MKLNFWQWIGVLVLVAGGAWYVYDKNRCVAPAKQSPTSTPPVATRPA